MLTADVGGSKQTCSIPYSYVFLVACKKFRSSAAAGLLRYLAAAGRHLAVSDSPTGLMRRRAARALSVEFLIAEYDSVDCVRSEAAVSNTIRPRYETLRARY